MLFNSSFVANANVFILSNTCIDGMLNTFWQPHLKNDLVLKKMCITKVILASVISENMFSADELQACAAVHESVATSER